MGVKVSMGAGVAVGVLVGVTVGVKVPVGVGVAVGVLVGMAVGVRVPVGVGVTVGVLVGVAVGIKVPLGVGVAVGVLVGVAVGVKVSVGMADGAGVLVGVAVGVDATEIREAAVSVGTESDVAPRNRSKPPSRKKATVPQTNIPMRPARAMPTIAEGIPLSCLDTPERRRGLASTS